MVELLPAETLAQTLFWLTGAAAFTVAAFSGIVSLTKHRAELRALQWDPARRAYESFLDLAIANAEFIPGYWSDPVRTREERNKYRWFMARFLWAAEEALLHVPKRQRKEWERVVKVMLREHADFIASPETRDEVDGYFGALNGLIEEVVKNARAGSPAI